MLTRRAFVAQLSAALVAFEGSRLLGPWAGRVSAAAPPPVVDSFSALVAFVVPGSDSYSVAQGVSTPEPGGVDAGIIDHLIESFDLASPTPPSFPSTSAFVAYVLDQFAFAVSGGQSGFAGLSYGDKMTVFFLMEQDPQAAPLAQAVITLAAFASYSEAGVFDPATRTLTGTPVGWELTGYPGVSDGRDEFVGYYRGRRTAKR